VKHTVTLFNAQQGHAAYRALWDQAKALLIAGHKLNITLKTETRSNAQNRLLWQRLAELAAGVDWYGNKLTADEWKQVLSASLRQQKVVPGIERGQFVVLGQRTSTMTVTEMTEMLDCISAFAAQHGVELRDEDHALETA
jgi:NinB protein